MTGPATWPYIIAFIAAIVATGVGVFTVMRLYYKNQSDMADGHDKKLKSVSDEIVKMVEDASSALKDSIKGVHSRVDTVQRHAREDLQAFRDDVKDMFAKHEKHMKALFAAHSKKVETAVRNGDSKSA